MNTETSGKSTKKPLWGKTAFVFSAEVLCAVLLVVFDLFTKSAAAAELKGQTPIVLIEGVLELRYVQNTGAAFSLLENAQWLFILAAIAVIAVIAAVLVLLPNTRHYVPMHILLTLIAAGAAGNLIDRITLHYVRDFIYFSLIDFPIFNVADIYVTVSTVLLVLCILFYYEDEDFVFLHRSRRTAS